MLEVDQLIKQCGAFNLGPLQLEVTAGEHLVLLGPSGSGKSLFLEILCGFSRADSGNVLLNGNDILGLRPDKRKVGLVMQHPALFPHLTVAQNIAYAMRAGGLSHKTIKKEVQNLAGKCKVDHLLQRNPESLSGGEIQRVSIARTLAAKPRLLLLDEPLSSLDVQLRDELRKFIHGLKEEQIPVLHVTHDPEEALRLADRVGVMHDGKIVQLGDPATVMHNPSNAFVAKMSGTKNYFRAIIIPGNSEADTNVARVGKLNIKFAGKAENSAGFVLIDENQISISLSKPDSSSLNVFEGIISECNRMSNGAEITVNVGENIIVRITNESYLRMQLALGMKCWISFKASAVRYLG